MKWRQQWTPHQNSKQRRLNRQLPPSATNPSPITEPSTDATASSQTSAPIASGLVDEATSMLATHQTDDGSIDPTNGEIVEKQTDVKTEPAPVAPVLLTMTPDQLRDLIAALPASSPAAGLTAEGLAEILKANREEQDSRRSVRHSNADHPHMSAFSHPEGDLKRPKPKLQAPDGRLRETYFNNHIQSLDELTPFEVECFNAITADCTARGGTWKAKIDQDGRRLRVQVPSFTMDELNDLPRSLPEILMELAQGPKAVTPLDMLARIAELERLVSAQQAVGA